MCLYFIKNGDLTLLAALSSSVIFNIHAAIMILRTVLMLAVVNSSMDAYRFHRGGHAPLRITYATIMIKKVSYLSC